MIIEDRLRGMAYDQYRTNTARSALSFPEFYKDWRPTKAEWHKAANPPSYKGVWHTADLAIESNLGFSCDKGPSQV